MKLSLCLEMLFTDRPFVDRMRIAADLGYSAIEFWDWRDKDLSALVEAAASRGLAVAAMSGNRQHALINSEDRAGLLEEMDQVFDVASQLSCPNIMMLSDVLNEDGSAAPSSPGSVQDKKGAVVGNLCALADRAEAAGVTLLLEPLNTALDHRGCFLSGSSVGVDLIKDVGSSHVKLLYDIYHMSMMDEDVLTQIDRNLEWIGYFHVADKPGRHQPGTGKIDYASVNALLKRANYKGFIGMEFSALGPDKEAAKAPLEIFK